MKVGRNDPCPCGSGEKYKKCCLHTQSKVRPRERKTEYLCAYVDFKHLFGTQLNDRVLLRREIESFNLDDFLQTTTKINYLLTDSYGIDKDEDLFILGYFLDDKIYNTALNLRKTGEVHVSLSHHQILSLMIENLLLKNRCNSTTNERLIDYGKVLFRITEFLENDILDNPKHKSVKEPDKTIGMLFRNMYINDSLIADHLFGRYYSIFFKYLPLAIKDKKIKKEKFNFVNAFKEKTGVDLKLYMCLVFIIGGHYSKRNFKDKLEFLRKPENFVISNLLSGLKKKYVEEARRAFYVFSNDRKGFGDLFKDNLISDGNLINYYRIEPFLKYPFYRLPNGNYFPLDLDFLQRKVTMGVKWDIHDAIRDKIEISEDPSGRKELEKQRNSLLAFYGRTLELYTNDLLKRMMRKQKETILLNDTKDTGGVDYIIYDCKNPESIIFIELTTSWIHYRKVMQGDLKIILDQFKDLFVKRDSIIRESKEKIRQLDDAIKDFRNHRLKKLNTIEGKVKKIYTVLLTEIGFPQFPGLTEKYLDIIRKENLLGDELSNFQFIDLEEWELIEPLLEKKYGYRVTQLLEGRLAYDNARWPFKNYLYKNKIFVKNKEMHMRYKDIIKDGNKFFQISLKQRIESVIDQIKRKLFQID